MSSEPILRPTARVLLLDEIGRLLLFRAEGVAAIGEAFWITPGGGVQQGETYEQAAERELWEETGITAAPGPCVWRRSIIGSLNGLPHEFRERYYVVRVTAPAIHNRNWEPDEHRFLVGHHWWSLDEISRSDEIFVPRRLGELLPPILTCHYPSEPIEVGV